jgi:hypothetical protein
MLEKKRKPKSKQNKLYEADTLTLEAMRLIAAPDPKDDLSDEELVAYVKKHKFSPSLIRQIVDTVKSL